MAQLVFNTQIYKNRIGADWNGKGTPPKRWELHTHKTHKIEVKDALSEEDLQVAVRDAAASITKNDAFIRENVIDWTYEEDKITEKKSVKDVVKNMCELVSEPEPVHVAKAPETPVKKVIAKKAPSKKASSKKKR